MSSSEAFAPVVTAVTDIDTRLEDLRSTLLARIGSGGGGAVSGTDVYRDVVQPITTHTQTLISFTTEIRDDAGLWDAGTPSRLTIPTDGVYDVRAGISWANAPGGVRQTGIRKNGLQFVVVEAEAASPTFETFQNPSRIVECVAGDFLTVAVYQDTGGDVNVNANSYSCWLAAWRL